MKIRIYANLLILSLTIGVAACNSGDSDSKTIGKYTKSQFEGEWCAMEGSVAMILNLKSSSLTGEVFTNLSATPVLYETLSGPWYYYPENDVLRMQLLHSLSGHSVTTDYKILKVSSNVLQLREQETGAEDLFYRLIDSKSIDQGNTFIITNSLLGSVSPSGFASSNSEIASVDANGLVKANCQGVAFISIFTQQDEMLIVKVKVKGIVELFADEVMTNIDQVTAKLGAPDISGQLDQNQAVLYKQPVAYPKLEQLQYQYDGSTREITRIVTVYKSQVDYNKDADFIRANYIDHDKGLYGEDAEFMSNEYLISPFISDGKYFISYNNYKYRRREAHF